MNKTSKTITSLISVLLLIGATKPPAPASLKGKAKSTPTVTTYPTQGSGAVSLLSKAAPFKINTNLVRTVLINWGPSPSPNITNYTLYSGSASNAYTNASKAGTNLFGTVSYIRTNRVWFAATATDRLGLESIFSLEAFWPPFPLTNLVIIVTGTNLAWSTNSPTGPWTVMSTNITSVCETNPVGPRKFWQGINANMSTFRFNNN